MPTLTALAPVPPRMRALLTLTLARLPRVVVLVRAPLDGPAL